MKIIRLTRTPSRKQIKLFVLQISFCILSLKTYINFTIINIYVVTMIAPDVKVMYNRIIGHTYDVKNNFIFLKKKIFF